ncbi:hypothetical protein BKA63DRAFT_56169 [Paraphoma chrysanthemicola]|nr:hypothetical protein BKA63DRAFT_56169 [Paraphoma chrysanthemicola]
MHHTRFLATCIFTSQLVSSLSIDRRNTPNTRDVVNTPDEVVYLADCMKYSAGNSSHPESVGSLLVYHPQFDTSRDFPQSQWYDADEPSPPKAQPASTTSQQIDWPQGKSEDPITGTFASLGRNFSVHGLGTQGNPDTNATGMATLGDQAMRCYAQTTTLQSSFNGAKYKCHAPYYCTRESRQIRRTLFQISKQTVAVQILGEPQQPRDPRIEGIADLVYYWLQSAGSDAQNGVTEYVIDAAWQRELGIQPLHSIRIDVQDENRKNDPKYDEARKVHVANHLRSTLMPIILGTLKFERKEYAAKTMDVWSAQFPAHIQVQEQIAYQNRLDWKVADVFDINIVSRKHPECKADEAWAKVLANMVALGKGDVKGGYSALLSGLGGVSGGVHDATCLASW